MAADVPACKVKAGSPSAGHCHRPLEAAVASVLIVDFDGLWYKLTTSGGL